MLGAVCSIVVIVLFLWGVYILLLKLEEGDVNNRTYQGTKQHLPIQKSLDRAKQNLIEIRRGKRQGHEPAKPLRKKSFRNLCTAKTVSGNRCRNKAKYNSYCGFHAGNYRCTAKTGSGRRCRLKSQYGSFCKIHAGSYKEVVTRSGSRSYARPMCRAATPRGTCQYYAIEQGEYCNYHSEVEKITVPTGLPTQKKYKKMILQLENAIENRSVVGFAYYRGTSPGKRRDIIPEEIIHHEMGEFLVRGQCLLRKDERQFNLTFMRSLRDRDVISPKKDSKARKPTKVKSKKGLKRAVKVEYDINYFKKHYGYKYSFSDRKVDGMSVEEGLEAISGLPFLCFSPITVAVFCLVHRNKKKIRGTYRKEIKAEIDEYLKDKISYKYISDFILELYGKTKFDGMPEGDGKQDVDVAFKYSKKMLRRVVLLREGISPKEATLEFKKSPIFKKSLKVLETLSDRVRFLNNYELRTCNKCRLVGIEEIWFRSYRKRGEVYYKKTCKICG